MWSSDDIRVRLAKDVENLIHKLRWLREKGYDNLTIATVDEICRKLARMYGFRVRFLGNAVIAWKNDVQNIF